MENAAPCNGKYVAAYVLLLERLRKEGTLEGFSEEDTNHLIEKSIEYFDRFNDNYRRFEKIDRKDNTSRPLNLVSKHHLTFVDYEEEVGDRLLSVDGSDLEVFTRFDVEAYGEDYIIEIDDNDKGKILAPMTTDKMGIELDYNRAEEIFDISTGDEPYSMDQSERWRIASFREEVLRPINEVFDDNLKKSEHRKLLEIVNENLMPSIAGFQSYLERRYPEASETISRYIDPEKTGEILKSSIFMEYGGYGAKGEDVEPSLHEYSATKPVPVIINGEEMIGSFIDKARLTEDFSEKIFNALMNIMQITINRAVEKAETEGLDGDVMEEARELMLPAIKEIVSHLVDVCQYRKDNEIIEAFNMLQEGNVKSVTSYMMRRFGNSNNALIDKYSKSKDGLVFDILARGVKEEILSTPITAKGELRYASVSFYSETLNDTLDRIKRIPLVADKIRMRVSLKKKRSNILVGSFKNTDGTPADIKPAVYRNDVGYNYLISKKYIENNRDFKVLALDESDKKADGKFARTFRVLARGAENIIAASGTPTAGMAKDIVSQLALGGGMRLHDVSNNQAEFTRQCGVFEVSSPLLAKMVFSISNEEYGEEIKNFYRMYANAISQNKGKVSGNIQKMLTDGVENVIVKKLIEYNLADAADFADIEFTKESRRFKALFDAMLSLDNETNGVLGFENLTKQALFSSHTLVKLRPGINNPKTFVSLIQSAGSQNTSIMARETLTGKKETLTILDLEAHKSNFPKRQKETSTYTFDKFLRSNRVGVRLVQSAIKEYAADKFLYDKLDFLVQNFKYFMQNFNDNRGRNKRLKVLASYMGKKLDMPFSDSTLSTLFEKTTTEKNDSFVDIYKQYILANGNLDDSEYKGMDRERRLVFDEMLKLFDHFVKDGIKDLNAGKKYLLPLDGTGTVDLSGSSYSFQNKFSSLRGELKTEELVACIKNGYPEGSVFSAVIELCPPELHHIFTEPDKETGYYIPYRLNFTNKHENRVFDAIASKGILNDLEDKISSDISFVISSARTAGTAINFLSVLDAAYKHNRDEGQLFSTVLNVPSSSSDGVSYRSIASRLDWEKFEKGGVHASPIPRSALDATTKSSLKKGMQTGVVTNYESASRGLDLSGLNEIYATGAMEKGKEMIQFLARLYSVSRQDAVISMFHGGEDAQLVPAEKEDKIALVDIVFSDGGEGLSAHEKARLVGKHISDFMTLPSRTEADMAREEEVLKSIGDFEFRATETGRISELSIDKQTVFKAFILGRNTSIHSAIGASQTKEGEIFEPSKGYENRVESVARDIESGVYIPKENKMQHATKRGTKNRG